MHTLPLLLTALLATTSTQASPHRRHRRQSTSTSNSTTAAPPVVVDATYDGQCFYPNPTADFDLESYLGRWYQVAGTVAPFTAGCKCIYAEYGLNDNGTVSVANGCEAAGRDITIQGTATPVNASLGYGDAGVLSVAFPGTPSPECPGPNYIVQDVQWGDDLTRGCGGDFAIVQASNFSTLFLLSREQHVANATIEAWLERARRLGSDLREVVVTDQTNCSFT